MKPFEKYLKEQWNKDLEKHLAEYPALEDLKNNDMRFDVWLRIISLQSILEYGNKAMEEMRDKVYEDTIDECKARLKMGELIN